MNNIKKFLQNWFGLSRRESSGFIILFLLLFLLVASPLAGKYFFPASNYDRQSYLRDSLLLAGALAQLQLQSYSRPLHRAKDSLFYFDPNRLDVQQWQQLSVKPSLAQRIVNYRQKGGTFRIKSDLKKIYGFPEALYGQLAPWIQLPEQQKAGPTLQAEKKAAQPQAMFYFDINSADSSQLERVKGIGSVLARRIIRFREALGGFYHLEQLKEVYGLPLPVYQTLLQHARLPAGATLRKINLAEADFYTLRSHPYIGYELAKSIANYRKKHPSGPPEELLQLLAADSAQLARLRPYLHSK